MFCIINLMSTNGNKYLVKLLEVLDMFSDLCVLFTSTEIEYSVRNSTSGLTIYCTARQLECNLCFRLIRCHFSEHFSAYISSAQNSFVDTMQRLPPQTRRNLPLQGFCLRIWPNFKCNVAGKIFSPNTLQLQFVSRSNFELCDKLWFWLEGVLKSSL